MTRPRLLDAFSGAGGAAAGYHRADTAFCYVFGGGQAGQPVATWREAMDIDWMTVDELSQAIPPVYTEHIGVQLLDHIRAEATA